MERGTEEKGSGMDREVKEHTAAGQLGTSERGVCGGPLAFQYANLMSHTAFHQSMGCVSLLYQEHREEREQGGRRQKARRGSTGSGQGIAQVCRAPGSCCHLIT
jgi:hypothetical protein